MREGMGCCTAVGHRPWARSAGAPCPHHTASHSSAVAFQHCQRLQQYVGARARACAPGRTMKKRAHSRMDLSRCPRQVLGSLPSGSDMERASLLNRLPQWCAGHMVRPDWLARAPPAVGVPGGQRGGTGLLPRRLVLLDPPRPALTPALPPRALPAPQVRLAPATFVTCGGYIAAFVAGLRVCSVAVHIAALSRISSALQREQKTLCHLQPSEKG